MKRFLKGENGDIDVIEMRCINPRAGLSAVMEDTLDHLPDIGIFKFKILLIALLKSYL